MKPALSIAGVLALLVVPTASRADEGMFLYTNPPLKLLRERYKFEEPGSWFDHLQKSSVRFNSGGSGSFVSADGLVITNHHVGLDVLEKISDDKHDYVKTGFHAKSLKDEVKSPDSELNVLMEIKDVTDQVNAAVKPEMKADEANLARRAIINTIQENALKDKDRKKWGAQVVTLYQGGQYHLYSFRKYTDVRLVFAPEVSIAFFGGDPDNFEFPRYDLDICIFRVWEDDKPAKIDNYLKWSPGGSNEGDLIFVSGHPGRTDRLNTVAHLEYLRDFQFPRTLDLLRRREVALKTFSDRDDENARRAHDEYFSIQNSRKARLGGIAGLQDPVLMDKKRQDEKDFRAAVDKDAKLKAEYGDAWDMVAQTIKELKPIAIEYSFLERGVGFNTQLFGIARAIVRLAEERTKDNAKRLPEFSKAREESLLQQLLSEAPIYDDLETMNLADSLSHMLEQAGNSETVQKALAGKSPRDRAAELIKGTGLRDVATRKKLIDGGMAAVEASKDPMIQLARQIDAESRRLRKIFEEKVDEPQKQAYKKIANALFAVKGKDQYPDATFTLRISLGVIKGYEENGKKVPAFTNMGGAFKLSEKHNNKEPFNLPESWIKYRKNINEETPFNFVSTADIIGGNSGSPVVNRKGEFVGIIFDGNIQSLVLDFAYEETIARAVSVDSRAIVEALRKIYDANEIADELTGKKESKR
jgi:hypothetical protein